MLLLPKASQGIIGCAFKTRFWGSGPCGVWVTVFASILCAVGLGIAFFGYRLHLAPVENLHRLSLEMGDMTIDFILLHSSIIIYNLWYMLIGGFKRFKHLSLNGQAYLDKKPWDRFKQRNIFFPGMILALKIPNPKHGISMQGGMVWSGVEDFPVPISPLPPVVCFTLLRVWSENSRIGLIYLR